MKAITLTLILGSLGAAATLPLSAQQGQGQRPDGARPGPGPSPIFRSLDANRDGVISTEELAHAPEVLAALDQDGDGNITRGEIRPRPPHGRSGRVEGEGRPGPRGEGPRAGARPGEHPGPGLPPCPLFNTIDLDGDGALSPSEIAASWKSLLDLDADGDGNLTREEIRPARPRGERPSGECPGRPEGERPRRG